MAAVHKPHPGHIAIPIVTYSRKPYQASARNATVSTSDPPDSNQVESTLPASAGLFILRDIHLLQLALAKVIQQSVDLKTALLDSLDDGGYPLDHIHRRLDIQTSKLVHLLRLLHLAELLVVLLPQRAHGLQPHIKDTKVPIPQRSIHTTTARMPTHNHMLDLQVPDTELDHTEQRDIRRADDVGDVAVDKDVARLHAHDGGLRHARVGAADPEDLGSLAFGAGGEEVWVGGGSFGGPFFVVLEGLLEGVGAVCVSHGG